MIPVVPRPRDPAPLGATSGLCNGDRDAQRHRVVRGLRLWLPGRRPRPPAPGRVRARHRRPHGATARRHPRCAVSPGLSGLRRGADPGARAARHPRRRLDDDPPARRGRPRGGPADRPAPRRPRLPARGHVVVPRRRPRRPAPVGARHQPPDEAGDAARGRRRLAAPRHSRAASDPLRRGRLGRRVDDDDRGADAGDQGRRVARRGAAPPAFLPVLPAESRGSAPGVERTGPRRCAGVGRQHPIRLRADDDRLGAGLVRAQPGRIGVRARSRRHVRHPRADLAVVDRGSRPADTPLPPLGPGPRRARRRRTASDRRQQLGGHLLLVRHRPDSGPHRPHGAPGRRALPARRRLVRPEPSPRRRHDGAGRLGGRSGQAAGRPRPPHAAGRRARRPIRAVGRARDGEPGLHPLRRAPRLGGGPTDAAPAPVAEPARPRRPAARCRRLRVRRGGPRPDGEPGHQLPEVGRQPAPDRPRVSHAGRRPAGQLLGRPRPGHLAPDGDRGRAAPRADAHAVRLGRRKGRPRFAALVPRGLALGQHRSARPGADAVGRLALPAGQCGRRPRDPGRRPAGGLRLRRRHERAVRLRHRLQRHDRRRAGRLPTGRGALPGHPAARPTRGPVAAGGAGRTRRTGLCRRGHPARRRLRLPAHRAHWRRRTAAAGWTRPRPGLRGDRRRPGGGRRSGWGRG